MVLPELSRTMAYTTPNRVNRMRKELNLNPVVLELQKHKLDQIILRTNV